LDKEEVLQAKDKAVSHLRSIFGDEAETVVADRRYGFISALLKDTLKKPAVEAVTLSDKVDRVLLNRLAGIPIFLAILYGVFQLTFTLSGPLMERIIGGFEWLGDRATGISPEWFGSLLGNGVISGVGTVLSFIPPIFLIFVAIAVLEDSGYMARAAFVADRVMHSIGLHGRSFIPLVLGFGCNVPAVMATRTIENPRDRLTTIVISPLMSCGGRLPIYALFAAAFFGAHRGAVVFSFYLIGMLLAFAIAFALRKSVLSGPSAHFVMELPPYRLPTVRGTLIHTWERGREFLIRAGTIIFAAVVLIWFLGSMPWGVEYGSESSWIGHIGGQLAPLFAPCGFGDWQAATALIFGFFAKEAVVGTFGVLFAAERAGLAEAIQTGLGWTPLVAYAFMAFSLVYMPCAATVAIIKKESRSWKWTAFAVGYSLALAWIVATLIYQIGRLFVE
jgi:ferrous iron transport protein B